MAQARRSLAMRIDTEDPLYRGLNKIKMKGKELYHVPQSLFSLEQLEVLDLSPEREACLSYKLYQIPTQIGKLVNLKILMLDTNELLELPLEIGNLQELERFTASNNNLTSLPPTMSRLRKLRSLHLSNNDFSEFPEIVCNLKSLEFLDLSDNAIRELPESLGNLRELRTLMLFYNQLKALPESICDLSELNCLWVGNNRLRRLPRNFARLKKLDMTRYYTSSMLHGNPLIHPPLEICLMGHDAIERYHSRYDQSNSEKRPLHRPVRPRKATTIAQKPMDLQGDVNQSQSFNQYQEIPAIKVNHSNSTDNANQEFHTDVV